MSSEYERAFEVEGRRLKWQGLFTFKSDLKNFYYTYTRRLFENDQLIREKSWDDVIERDHQ